MTVTRTALPGLFVQAIHKVLACPCKIYIQPDKDYGPKAGEDEKYYARITANDVHSRKHCETLLRALSLNITRFISDGNIVHCELWASDIKRIVDLTQVDKPKSKVFASNLEKYLKKLFKEVKFSSELTDFTVEYVATVESKNMRSFLQVLVNLGIDDWQSVDGNEAVAFTLSRLPAEF